MRSEREILSEIRRLRHQLDRQRLTRTLAELKPLQAEIKALRAHLPKVESSTAAGDAHNDSGTDAPMVGASSIRSLLTKRA